MVHLIVTCHEVLCVLRWISLSIRRCSTGWLLLRTRYTVFHEFCSRFIPRGSQIYDANFSTTLSQILCCIYIWVCDMSKTNVAMSATNCLFTLGRWHCRQPIYDKFLETKWRWFRMWRRQCLQCIFGFVHVGHKQWCKSRTRKIANILRPRHLSRTPNTKTVGNRMSPTRM